MVGFLGPNGAGKTTTLKMVSGVLHPTAGTVRVLGYEPWKRRRDYLRKIALVRGSRPVSAPIELTVHDALRFQGLVYDVGQREFEKSAGRLIEMLDLAAVLQRQIRALSLGERMRVGLAMALLYRPSVLLLDEPTIGLDVNAAELLRRFLLDYQEEAAASIILTSHQMRDVEMLCRRVILIDHGRIAYDGDLSELNRKLVGFKVLKIWTAEATSPIDWSRFGDLVHRDAGVIELRVPRSDVPAVTSRVLSEVSVSDISIQEPPIEGVLAAIYREGVPE
jgi:ABC-2 type transport system ATP-binding protein